MRDLIILGTGVHCAEMAEIVARINQVKKAWNIIGYIAPDQGEPPREMNGHPVLGKTPALEKYPHAGVALFREEWFQPVPVPRARLVSIIDPSVFVSRTASIGVGCTFYPGGYIGLNTRIGDLVCCLDGVIINHDNVIGEQIFMAAGATLAGCVKVEDGCYIGQACNIKQYLTIGRHSFIGMGAVVVKAVPSNSLMIGNPARKLRDNQPAAWYLG